jgi:nucleotide-binding universal stress UspA family protein
MYDDVLLPTDGSATAEGAVEHAVDLADRHGARLHAVFVVDLGRPNVGPGTVSGLREVVDAVREEGDEATAAVAERAREAGVEATAAVVEHERPPDAILRYARTNGADAIVMGTQGRSGLQRWLVGSVAERVVRSSPVPVMLVPPDPDDEDG